MVVISEERSELSLTLKLSLEVKSSPAKKNSMCIGPEAERKEVGVPRVQGARGS